MKEITSNRCSRCGAPINWDESSLILRCSFCGKQSIVGDNLFKIVEIKVLYSLIKKNLKFILPILILSLIGIVYINSKKIKTYNFTTYDQAWNACKAWQKANNDITDFNKNLKLKGKRASCNRSEATRKEWEDKRIRPLKGTINAKLEHIELVDFGKHFNSLNKCYKSKDQLIRKYEDNRNRKIIGVGFTCFMNYKLSPLSELPQPNIDEDNIYLIKSVRWLVGRYKYGKT